MDLVGFCHVRCHWGHRNEITQGIRDARVLNETDYCETINIFY
jgi:hypothetical protein